jgi:hypothetical protein
MRVGRHVLICGAALAGAVVGATASPGEVVCSVFSRHPCAPTVCSVFHHRPCLPLYPFPLGENLQLTVGSTEATQGKPVDHDHAIDTIHDMFVALRACWQPPEPDEARQGMQMSVRFAFKRTGELIGEPRVTYTTPGVEDDTRQVYRRAITEALDRCTPLPFSAGMGGAIAGRPIAVRFVDNRPKPESNPDSKPESKQGQEHQP